MFDDTQADLIPAAVLFVSAGKAYAADTAATAQNYVADKTAQTKDYVADKTGVNRDYTSDRIGAGQTYNTTGQTYNTAGQNYNTSGQNYNTTNPAMNTTGATLGDRNTHMDGRADTAPAAPGSSAHHLAESIHAANALLSVALHEVERETAQTGKYETAGPITGEAGTL